MNFETLAFAVILLVAVGGMSYVVLSPFFERDPAPARPKRKRGMSRQTYALETLAAEKQRVLRAVRDLDFDYDMGKLIYNTYAEQRINLIRLAVAIILRMDELEAEIAAHEAEIEAAVAALRGKPAPDSIPAASKVQAVQTD